MITIRQLQKKSWFKIWQCLTIRGLMPSNLWLKVCKSIKMKYPNLHKRNRYLLTVSKYKWIKLQHQVHKMAQNSFQKWSFSTSLLRTTIQQQVVEESFTQLKVFIQFCSTSLVARISTKQVKISKIYQTPCQKNRRHLSDFRWYRVRARPIKHKCPSMGSLLKSCI